VNKINGYPLKVSTTPSRAQGARAAPPARDARRGLRWQIKFQALQQKLLVGVRFGVAAQDQRAAVGGWEVAVDHLDGGGLVEHGPWREAGGQRLELGAQRDVKAIGLEGNEDVCFDPMLKSWW
jgi:hypothetical protein